MIKKDNVFIFRDVYKETVMEINVGKISSFYVKNKVRITLMLDTKISSNGLKTPNVRWDTIKLLEETEA